MLEHPPLNPVASASSAQGGLSPAPTLSVGLPVYNGAKWIEEAIESILEQSFEDFELIISDNVSTDETEEICRWFAARDSRVRYCRNSTNIGLYRNFDRVFELASGKYFKWAADSDFCLDGFFDKCVSVLEDRPDVVLAYTQAYLLQWDPTGNEVAVEYEDDFNLQDEQPSVRFSKYLRRERINNVMHGIIRVSALRETSLIRPMAGSDINMVAELSLRGKFVEVPDRLFVRRFDVETSSMLMSRSTADAFDVPLGRSIKHRVSLQAFRFITVLNAPISLPEKVRVWIFLFGTLSPFQRVVSLVNKVFRKLTGIVRPSRYAG